MCLHLECMKSKSRLPRIETSSWKALPGVAECYCTNTVFQKAMLVSTIWNIHSTFLIIKPWGQVWPYNSVPSCMEVEEVFSMSWTRLMVGWSQGMRLWWWVMLWFEKQMCKSAQLFINSKMNIAWIRHPFI